MRSETRWSLSQFMLPRKSEKYLRYNNQEAEPLKERVLYLSLWKLHKRESWAILSRMGTEEIIYGALLGVTSRPRSENCPFPSPPCRGGPLLRCQPTLGALTNWIHDRCLTWDDLSCFLSGELSPLWGSTCQFVPAGHVTGVAEGQLVPFTSLWNITFFDRTVKLPIPRVRKSRHAPPRSPLNPWGLA